MQSDGADPQRPWPLLMDTRTAAAFLQMSERSASRLLAREGVAPLRLGLRLRRWRRTDIEALVDRLGASDERVSGGVEAALARVEERFASVRGRAGSARLS